MTLMVCYIVDAIDNKILQEWVVGKGQPPTWLTLIETFQRCNFNADKIEKNYLKFKLCK